MEKNNTQHGEETNSTWSVNQHYIENTSQLEWNHKTMSEIQLNMEKKHSPAWNVIIAQHEEDQLSMEWKLKM